jgi:hypothetical protein
MESLLPYGELKEEHHTQLKYQLPTADTRLPVVFRYHGNKFLLTLPPPPQSPYSPCPPLH